MTSRPAGYQDVVKRHWRETKGYVIASRQPCIRIRDDEVKRIKRVLVATGFDGLPLDLPKSWIVAVILCPGDDLGAVLTWARRHKVQGSRVWFFLHTGVDPETLRPWKDAGFKTDQAEVVKSWEDLHRSFGLALNDQVYADFKG